MLLRRVLTFASASRTTESGSNRNSNKKYLAFLSALAIPRSLKALELVSRSLPKQCNAWVENVESNPHPIAEVNSGSSSPLQNSGPNSSIGPDHGPKPLDNPWG